MRMAFRNKRRLWYSLLMETEKAYVRDENGNIVYEEIDGEEVPIETGGRAEEYSEPVPFFGTIQNAGGMAEAAAYGVSVGSYQAKLLDVDGALPIKEMSLIYTTRPGEHGAEYRVVRKPIALNQIVYLLARNE